MRLSRRIPMFIAITATVTGLLLSGGPVVLAGDHEESRHIIKVDHKGEARVVYVDEDGERHEEVFEFDGNGPRAFLGVHLEKADDGGAVVRKVIEDSAAERAGLEVGDIIVGIDGEDVDNSMTITKKIFTAKPGDRVDLDIMRDGASRTVTAELGEREGLEAFEISGFDTEEFEEKMEMLQERLENLDIHIEGLDEHLDDLSVHIDEDLDIPGLQRKIIAIVGNRPILGVQLVQPTPELREHLGAEPEHGVLVSKVLTGMPAEEAGVEVGDIILALDGEEIEDAGDLVHALEGQEGETVELEIIRDGRSLFIDVSLPERQEEE